MACLADNVKPQMGSCKVMHYDKSRGRSQSRHVLKRSPPISCGPHRIGASGGRSNHGQVTKESEIEKMVADVKAEFGYLAHRFVCLASCWTLNVNRVPDISLLVT